MLAQAPQEPEALCGLGEALFRQDRNREARDALRRCEEESRNPGQRAQARRLRTLVERAFEPEAALAEQRIAHFHVRYDGEAHDEVGREVLGALERHYATLVTTLDYQPKRPIPVILLSADAYKAVTGLRGRGMYGHADGRIRIRVEDAASGLTPDLNNTLLHELTHAFVRDRAGVSPPRDLNEGLAEYVMGTRVGYNLTREQVAAFEAGAELSVRDFYAGALSFVEHLIGQRGMGGINDLLETAGRTGNWDEAFRRVYGQDYRRTREGWLDRLRLMSG